MASVKRSSPVSASSLRNSRSPAGESAAAFPAPAASGVSGSPCTRYASRSPSPVEVEQRRPGTHDLRQQEPVAGAVPVLEDQADFGGALLEGCRRRQRGSRFRGVRFTTVRGLRLPGARFDCGRADQYPGEDERKGGMAIPQRVSTRSCGSTTVRNGKRWKSLSRVQIRPIPCSRMSTAVCRSWQRLPRMSGCSSRICSSTSSWREVATSTSIPGAAKMLRMKLRASCAAHGVGSTRG